MWVFRGLIVAEMGYLAFFLNRHWGPIISKAGIKWRILSVWALIAGTAAVFILNSFIPLP